MDCEWCKNTGKIQLIDKCIDCDECNKQKKSEINYNDQSVGDNLYNTKYNAICSSKILYINYNETKFFELYAGYCGAFKPKKISFICRDPLKFDKKFYLKIKSISVLGIPQINLGYNSYIDSEIFSNQTKIDFCVFGSSAGQGLNFEIENPHMYTNNFTISVVVYGFVSEIYKIGRR